MMFRKARTCPSRHSRRRSARRVLLPWRALVASGVLAVMAGCASLQPARNAPSLPSQPVESAWWTALAQARPAPWFHLLNAGSEALEWRLRAIDAATRSIDLETFLWKADQAGSRMIAHLLAAADRGVKVRILLDDSFTMHQDFAWRAIATHPNLAVRIYNPYRRRTGGAVARLLLNLGEFARVDHRMHNKVLLVDGRLAIVGGRNVADEYYGHDPAFNFRDLDVMTLDGATREIAGHFNEFWSGNWSLAIESLLPEPGRDVTLPAVRQWLDERVRMPVRVAEDSLREWQALARSAHRGRAHFVADHPAKHNPAAPDEAPVDVANALVDLIGRARAEVIAVSAYLIPTERFERTIADAGRRGVGVRILTNSLRSNNHLAAHAAYRNHVEQLIRSGAEVHEVRAVAKDRERYMIPPAEGKRLGLHAKLLVVDDHSVYIGSCNLDPRSLRINTEVGLLIEGREFNDAVREALRVDFHPRNAWALRLVDDRLLWVGDDLTLDAIPADSPMQRIEDWFLSLVPAEAEL